MSKNKRKKKIQKKLAHEKLMAKHATRKSNIERTNQINDLIAELNKQRAEKSANESLETVNTELIEELVNSTK